MAAPFPPSPSPWRTRASVFGLLCGSAYHFANGPLPLLSALVGGQLPEGDGPGGGAAYFTNWVLIIQTTFFVAAFVLDVLVAAAAVTRRTCSSTPTLLSDRWLKGALAHVDRCYFLTGTFAVGMGGLFNIQWLIDGCPPIGGPGDMRLLHMAPLWRALGEAVLVPHRLRHGPWWVEWVMSTMISAMWSVHYESFHALSGAWVYKPPWPASQFVLVLICLPAVHLLVAGMALIRVAVCRRVWLGRYRRARADRGRRGEGASTVVATVAAGGEGGSDGYGETTMLSGAAYPEGDGELIAVPSAVFWSGVLTAAQRALSAVHGCHCGRAGQYTLSVAAGREVGG